MRLRSPLFRLRARREAGPPAPFVVGVGRSGTTLLRLMLDAHPQLVIPPETHFLPDLIDAAGRGAGAEQLARIAAESRHWGDLGIAAPDFEARLRMAGTRPDRAARAFFELYAERHGKPRWGDKTPGYVKRMAIIGRALPEARFIHLIRDGRDVALSRRRRGMGAERPMAETAAKWRDRILAARRQARRLRGRYMELRYEDLVAEPEPSLRRVCEFIELPYDPEMLRYHERAQERLREMNRDLPPVGKRRPRDAAERMAAHALASEPPRPDRVAAWRSEMSPADRAAFESEAGSLLAELGYDVAS
ncbi:MAG TPA: sulfotransferase [Solirubrobacterales bacterium]|jgi:hypothetical protein